MSQIKQLLHSRKQGKGIKQIARITDMSKNTVKAYLSKLSMLKSSIDDLLLIEDSELESKFHAGDPAYKDERFDHLKTRLDYF